jgi:hypothetical protein
MSNQGPAPTGAQETLECPCCGDVGATANHDGTFDDGDGLECGCSGWVTVEEDGDVWINNGDQPCKPTAKCQEPCDD